MKMSLIIGIVFLSVASAWAMDSQEKKIEFTDLIMLPDGNHVRPFYEPLSKQIGISTFNKWATTNNKSVGVEDEISNIHVLGIAQLKNFFLIAYLAHCRLQNDTILITRFDIAAGSTTRVGSGEVGGEIIHTNFYSADISKNIMVQIIMKLKDGSLEEAKKTFNFDREVDDGTLWIGVRSYK